MLYDILRVVAERQQTVHRTTSLIFNNSMMVVNVNDEINLRNFWSFSLLSHRVKTPFTLYWPISLTVSSTKQRGLQQKYMSSVNVRIKPFFSGCA